MALVARRFLPLLAVLAALFAAAPAQAAAPNYILVSGPGIRNPILLADWNENLELLGSLVDAPVAKGRAVRNLARRPRFDLAEFWGWAGKRRPTRSRQANQHGSFYPAHRGHRAVVLEVNGEKVPRLAPARALRILARHKKPTSL